MLTAFELKSEIDGFIFAAENQNLSNVLKNGTNPAYCFCGATRETTNHFVFECLVNHHKSLGSYMSLDSRIQRTCGKTTTFEYTEKEKSP